ncbi:MAG TPA: class I adenylate-forming enzyme family protein [Sporichthya sp.]|nr:class I adenylate-forming enzyme family protein [Sporichthya sp.]
MAHASGAQPSARTLAGLLNERAEGAPAAVGAVTADSRATWAELRAGAARAAAALRRDGVGRGDRVAVLLDNRLEWLQVAFGAASLGAVVTPINTWVKTRDLDYLLGHAQPRVLVTIDQLGKQDYLGYLGELGVPGPLVERLVVVGKEVPAGAVSFDHWATGDADFVDVADPGEIALVLYTSGSTANPKAVPLTHRHLIENGWAIGSRQGLSPADRVFLSAPLAWAYGSANALMSSFTHGAALVLQSTFDAAGAYELLRRERCTSIYTLPVMTRALLDLPGFDAASLPDLRRGLTIGPPAELVLAHGALGVDQICNIYGSTETYGNCCVTPHDAPFARRVSSQGPPLDGVELRIVDVDTRAPLGVGQVGEILVRGRITPGYLGADRHPERVTDDSGFFATGDLGSLDADGWLTFAARDSEMIKTAGINVSPAEVEAFLASHPDVVEVAVVGAEAEVRGQVVVAFVRLVPGAEVTTDQLRAWCKDSIASYKAPAAVIAIEAMPTTPTGKLSRRDLVRLAGEHLRAV